MLEINPKSGELNLVDYRDIIRGLDNNEAHLEHTPRTNFELLSPSQFKPLHLAGGGFWQVVDDFYPARVFPFTDFFFHMLFEF